jgi:hypothetical protein
MEKLSPVLALCFVKDFPAALDTCHALLKFGGLGHTAVIYARDEARIREYALRVPAMRVLVNTPAPQGSTGITTNVFPAMTLGCGAVAGNITSDNIGPQHLINLKRLAYVVREPEEAFEMPLRFDAASVGGADTVDRPVVVAAVERYLAARGIGAPPKAHAEPSCGCSNGAADSCKTAGAEPAAVSEAAIANIAAQVVDRLLAKRGPARTGPVLPGNPGSDSPGGYG